MRTRFEQQIKLGIRPIMEVTFSDNFMRSRDELPPVLVALHGIFCNAELNKKIFEVIESHISKSTMDKGRKGMDLWHLIVFGVVRHALGCDWDRLLYISNNDEKVREILGVHSISNFEEKIEFKRQTIIDNISLLTEDVLLEVNNIVVEFGNTLFKKKASETLSVSLKTDSYVCERNVHFPTDINLLWDSQRKCFDIMERAHEYSMIRGWREAKNNRSNFKKLFRKTSNLVFKSPKIENRKNAAKNYIKQAKNNIKRFEAANLEMLEHGGEIGFLLSVELRKYINYSNKFIDQINRRIIKGEVIPTNEKIYSIFEKETEWIKKGKANNKVELGHQILITTNQFGLIEDYKIMLNEKDQSQVEELTKRLEKKISEDYRIESMSMDKGFWNKENYEFLQNSQIETIILPKKGKKNQLEQERENTPEFKKLRKKHSAVESSINMLEHHGLDLCRDKGMPNYKRHVGLSVLAMNLHIIGNKLLSQKMIDLQKKKIA